MNKKNHPTIGFLLIQPTTPFIRVSKWVVDKRLAIFFFAFLLLTINARSQQKDDTIHHVPTSRLTIGGYGEAVYCRQMYSDNVFRYSFADRYADSRGHGQVDIPHMVLMLGYDFGQGWSMGTEIEFEHGGTESAVELESEETGEYEKEIERGGEVALEQFWIQKSWGRGFNLRLGHDVVPVGATNGAHLPSQFFGVYRPEGEATILPCTWHATGVSVWGQVADWRYGVWLIPSLNSTLFSVSKWAGGASASPYEYTVANRLALAGRVDYYAAKGIRIGASGFLGNTFNNDIVTDEYSNRYSNVKALMLFGSMDFSIEKGRFTARGNLDYGHLNEAAKVSAFNSTLSNSSQSPYPHTLVGEEAIDAALELGWNWIRNSSGKQFITFARCDYYDSYIAVVGLTEYGWTERWCYSVGVNYRPVKEIILKAEAGIRCFQKQYNNEPWVALGVTYTGFFKH